MELFAAFPAAMGRSLPTIIVQAGPVGVTILLITFALSVMTWAVAWDRSRLYKKLRSRGDALRRAAGQRGVAAVMPEAEKYLPAIEAAILIEAGRFVQMNGGEGGVLAVEDPADLDHERNRLRGLLDGRALNEIGEMERHLILLSTTSAGAPFLGLFGTVWGIMHAFMSMGMEGSASIEIVGGGIAEALVTTMAGLGAAIPALVAYNLCVRAVRRKETQVDLFISRVVDGVVVRRGAQRGSSGAARPVRTGATSGWPTTTP
ncbi:MAG TPA: MotA/TolQ/ExbB proton channel family protein [Candidatus Krumholzibacteria bacterium]